MHDPEGGTTWAAHNYGLDLIEERTNGGVKFSQRYHSGQLFGPFEVLSGVQTGGCDFAFVMSVFYPAEMDLRSGLGIPLTADKAGKSFRAESEMLKDPRLVEEATNLGVHYLACSMGGYLLMYSTKPVNKYEDLAGLSTFTFGPYTYAAEAWGANPVMITEAEIYESLQKGLLDAGMGFWSSIGLFKLYEVADYALNVGLGAWSVGETTVFNLDTWNSLPSKYQKIIDEVFTEEVTPELFRLQSELDKGWVAEAKAGGMQLIQLPPAEMEKIQALSNVTIDAWINLKPEDATERRALVDDYLKVLEKTKVPEGWDYDSNEFFD
jgi:TRAP-type C4-dicarboxylate transport system substrate-binding protein